MDKEKFTCRFLRCRSAKICQAFKNWGCVSGTCQAILCLWPSLQWPLGQQPWKVAATYLRLVPQFQACHISASSLPQGHPQLKPSLHASFHSACIWFANIPCCIKRICQNFTAWLECFLGCQEAWWCSWGTEVMQDCCRTLGFQASQSWTFLEFTSKALKAYTLFPPAKMLLLSHALLHGSIVPWLAVSLLSCNQKRSATWRLILYLKWSGTRQQWSILTESDDCDHSGGPWMTDGDNGVLEVVDHR